MANIKYIGWTTNKNNLEWFYLSSVKMRDYYCPI